MPCNCGGGTTAQPTPQPTPQPVVAYQLNLPDGGIRQFVTHQEAVAANQRAGGTGTITVVTR